MGKLKTLLHFLYWELMWILEKMVNSPRLGRWEGLLVYTAVVFAALGYCIRFVWFPVFQGLQFLSNPLGGISKIRVYRPAGSIILKTIRFLFSEKVVDNVLALPIYDMRHEYNKALLQGEIKKANWILMKGRFIAIFTIFAYVVTTFGKSIEKIWKIGG
ncbi:MAG: hypothetical protein AAF429_09110 [Pseudomonadota bacterium]